MAIRPLNLKNQVKTLKIYPVKWSDYGSKSKAKFDRTTIKLRFFLEKRAIPPVFHCKYKRQARPRFFVIVMLKFKKI